MKSSIQSAETPAAIVSLHDSIMRLLVEEDPRIAMSVIFTLASKLSVALDINKTDYMEALSSGYDSFVLLAADTEGGVQ